MLTADEYLALVLKYSKKPRKAGHHDFDWYIDPLRHKFRLPEEDDEVWNRHLHITGFYPLGEAKPYVNINKVDNWLYDRVTGIVVTNLGVGCHEGFAQVLYLLYTGKKEDVKKDMFKAMRDDAALWAEEGMGFMLSTVSSRIQKGANVKLSAQEKAVFRGYEFTDI